MKEVTERDLLSTAPDVSAFPIEGRIVEQSKNNNNNLKKVGNRVSHCLGKKRYVYTFNLMSRTYSTLSVYNCIQLLKTVPITGS